MRQVVEIFLLFGLRTGHDHPHMQVVLANYMILLEEMWRDEGEQQAEVEALIESVKGRSVEGSFLEVIGFDRL